MFVKSITQLCVYPPPSFVLCLAYASSCLTNAPRKKNRSAYIVHICSAFRSGCHHMLGVLMWTLSIQFSAPHSQNVNAAEQSTPITHPNRTISASTSSAPCVHVLQKYSSARERMNRIHITAESNQRTRVLCAAAVLSSYCFRLLCSHCVVTVTQQQMPAAPMHGGVSIRSTARVPLISQFYGRVHFATTTLKALRREHFPRVPAPFN